MLNENRCHERTVAYLIFRVPFREGNQGCEASLMVRISVSAAFCRGTSPWRVSEHATERLLRAKGSGDGDMRGRIPGRTSLDGRPPKGSP